MPFDAEYRANYYKENKEKYYRRCVCGVCGRIQFRANLRRHQKSHLCKPPENHDDLEVIPPLPQPAAPEHHEQTMPSPSAPQSAVDS